MIKEICVPNITFSQKYLIDDSGNIWSPSVKDKPLKPSPTQKGYYRIVLQTTDGRKTFQLHRLVLMTFDPVPNMETLQVNHIDGDKGNNKLENLEWCTGSYNIKHSIETGLKVPVRGELVNGNKLTEEQVIEVCELLKEGNLSLTKIGEKFGVSKHCIYDIKKKRSWSWLTSKYNFD